MTDRVTLWPLADGADPLDVLAHWPPERPICALISGQHGAGEVESRWTTIAEPEPASEPGAGLAAGVVDGVAIARAGRSGPVLPAPQGWASPPAEVEVAGGVEAAGADGERPPFVGGWVLALEYELGHALEPRSAPARRRGVAAPSADLGRVLCCPRVLAYDHVRRRWWGAGPSGDGGPAWSPDEVVRRGASAGVSTGFTARRPAGAASGAGGDERADYEAGVVRALGHIAAGDVYQINLTRCERFEFAGSARGLMAALSRRARPWYGAYLELPATPARPRRAVASVSPELFIDLSPAPGRSASGRYRVRTRPMKGTRPAPGGSGPVAELRDSEKERAELSMIVDLMRNDLGRVCVPGSVRVEARRSIEPHAAGTLLQATATVTGELAGAGSPGGAVEVLLQAAFPPGSITGAPKVRAMQIIGELEAGPRGLYCGCLGFVSRCGRAGLNVAIRTAVIEATAGGGDRPGEFASGSTLRYGVGAGIVADSDPRAEWIETGDKAGVLMDVLGIAPEAGV